jgi:hypothetical protein
MATEGAHEAGDAGRKADSGREADSDREAVNAASFASLLIMLSSSAWMGLGKIADPVSGEVKKDLAGARYSIEMLGMLREKTKGNLGREEERLLNGMIADLQANYAEAVFSEGGTSGGEQSSGKAP